MTTLGRSVTSVIEYRLSPPFTSFPDAESVYSTMSSPDMSAMARKVVIRQEATDATKRCSGLQTPGGPPNCGGDATGKGGSESGDRRVPALGPSLSSATL